MSDGADTRFESLLEYLRSSRGFNFAGYKRTSLMRRIDRRMQVVGLKEYGEYHEFLELHPEEFAHLFDAILINVTDFYRDPLSWEALANDVIPKITASKLPGEPIRVWAAGCASGAEAYTLAMVLADALGIEASRDRVKIYATDVDEAALAKARLGCYEPRELQSLPPAQLEKYFEPMGRGYAFHRELRRGIIFGRHDLMQDAPISRIDLLVCRNTLMYFNSEAQSRILDRFHFALNPRGYLFLGKAETLLSYNHLFAAVDIKRRIFIKVIRGTRRSRVPLLAGLRDEANLDYHSSSNRLRDSAFEQCPFPLLVISASGLLAQANDAARRLLSLTPTDLDRPLQDLQISYRPVDLRSCIDRAYADRQAVVLTSVEMPVTTNAASGCYDIHAVPLIDSRGAVAGVIIAYIDVGEARHVKDELERLRRDLETAQEELQSANEELETTNEELQSANEELETTNEELQSANEELETTNEELQSANEELEAVNEELRQRSDELNETNFFQQAVLSSLNSGIAVIDPNLLVRAWNAKAEDLWGLRSDEVQAKDFSSLDIGLPVQELRQCLQECVEGRSPQGQVLLESVNRRGRSIWCRVTCTPMRDSSGIRGAVVEMEDIDNNKTERTAPTSTGDSVHGA